MPVREHGLPLVAVGEALVVEADRGPGRSLSHRDLQSRGVRMARRLPREPDFLTLVARLQLAADAVIGLVGVAHLGRERGVAEPGDEAGADEMRPGGVERYSDGASSARAYETAVTFRDEDQAARDAESRIRQELRDRYNVDVNETGADPSVVRASLAEQDGARRDREQLQDQARDDRDLAAGLTVGTEALELGADLEDAQEAAALRELAADIELTWDSDERREAHVAGIQAGDSPPAVSAAWKQADVDQARHPREAVKGGRPKSARAKMPTVTPGRQIERGR